VKTGGAFALSRRESEACDREGFGAHVQLQHAILGNLLPENSKKG